MSVLPVALTFDLDPDVFDESVAPTEARTKISWHCITKGIPLIRERIGEIAGAADLVVRYPTDDVGSLEFERVDELIAMGLERGRAALHDWLPGDVGGTIG